MLIIKSMKSQILFFLLTISFSFGCVFANEMLDPIALQAELEAQELAQLGTKYDLMTDTSYEKFLDDSHPFSDPQYIPSDLAYIISDFTFNRAHTFQLRNEAGTAFADLAWHFWNANGGKKKLSINSAYRSYKVQKNLTQNCHHHHCAKAGTSEHQAGLAIDLGVNGRRIDPLSLAWLQTNAHKWGYHQTYQKGIAIDGKRIEPRHWRYLGTGLATELYGKQMSFGEWFYTQSTTQEQGNLP